MWPRKGNSSVIKGLIEQEDCIGSVVWCTLALHPMDQANPARPPADDPGEAFNHGYALHQRIGLALALVLFASLWLSPALPGLTLAGTRVALLAAAMAVLWVTEAIPIPATALLPLILLPLLGISPIRQAAAPYSDPIIYLFMGGFMLALAMERWSLHRRIALSIIGAFGTRPRSLVLGFLCAGAFLSMWTSNAATAMMLMPIAVSVHALLGSAPGAVALGSALALAVAYGANVGGMGTLIGTPPNAIFKAYMERAVDDAGRADHFGLASVGAHHPHAVELQGG
jgi:sodium-dependent dicarboxylate transporter 2/3/5